MKSAGEAVEILEAFNLTGSLRAASELAGCSPNTVARYVRLRAIGRPSPESARRTQLIDPDLAKIEEWVDRSRGRVRADVVHDKLRTVGFEGSERTTRRAVADAKKAFAAGHRRVFRPWIPARDVAPVRLGQGPSDRRPGHAPLVRLARLVEVPGRRPDLGSDDADGHRLPR